MPLADPVAQPEFFTIQDASRAYGLSAQTLRRWLDSGKLVEYRPNRRVLIKASELAALVESSATRPPVDEKE